MINFSKLSNRSLPGKLMRSLLRVVPSNASVRILQGPLRGQRWVAGAATHGCWLGSYESEKQHAIADRLNDGDVFFDVGANVGFYTLLAAKYVGATGQVVAFEPFPGNVSFLQRHMTLNHLENVELFEAAVSDQAGTGKFSPGPDGCTGRLGGDGQLAVELVTLDDLTVSGRIPFPDVIKIDVEGAEFQVLKGAAKLLSDRHPVVFLATHGKQVKHDCLELLKGLRYQCEPLEVGVDPSKADEFVAIFDPPSA